LNNKKEGKKMSKKLHFQRYIFVFSIVLLAIVYGSTAMAVTTTAKPKPLSPQTIKPAGVQQIQFSRLDHGNVILLPAVLKIRYGQNVLELPQGGNGVINIPENSNLIDSQGKVTVMIEYTLKNTTAKRFSFNSLLRYNAVSITSDQVTLVSNRSKTITKTVKLQSTSDRKSIIIQGPVGISDDTHIIFFNAILWVRIYAL
jgi:hypothetical protein